MENIDLQVDYENLENNALTISSNCRKINNAISNIVRVLNLEWSGWIGQDSEKYVNSFKKTLDIVKKYSEEYNHISTYIKGIANDYKSIVNTCIEGLNNEQ